MTKEIKIEGYEEISEEEYDNLPDNEGLSIYDSYENKEIYFKKVQKLPIVFEDEFVEIEVDKLGIAITDKRDKECVGINYNINFPLLVKAVEKAKEVMGK